MALPTAEPWFYRTRFGILMVRLGFASSGPRKPPCLPQLTLNQRRESPARLSTGKTTALPPHRCSAPHPPCVLAAGTRWRWLLHGLDSVPQILTLWMLGEGLLAGVQTLSILIPCCASRTQGAARQVLRSPEPQEPQGCRSRGAWGFCSPWRSWHLGRCLATSQQDLLPPWTIWSDAPWIFSTLWALLSFRWAPGWFLFPSLG